MHVVKMHIPANTISFLCQSSTLQSACIDPFVSSMQTHRTGMKVPWLCMCALHVIRSPRVIHAWAVVTLATAAPGNAPHWLGPLLLQPPILLDLLHIRPCLLLLLRPACHVLLLGEAVLQVQSPLLLLLLLLLLEVMVPLLLLLTNGVKTDWKKEGGTEEKLQ